MSFDMTIIKTEPGSNGDTGALFEGLAVPADSAAVPAARAQIAANCGEPVL